MPSLFKQSSIDVLEQRKEQVNREIASLEAFRAKIDRRITHLRNRVTGT
jgi:chaperonin cofactor prefoldin